jgi:hypothetical protein
LSIFATGGSFIEDEIGRRLKGLGCMPGARRRKLKVLRQTSGALRQTEGKPHSPARRRQRRSAPVQALEPHGEARTLAMPEIHRCLKHLCRMRRRGAARMPRGVMRNPKLGEAFKPRRQKRAAPNINCMCESCGELEATEFAQIFLRRELAFSRRRCGDGKKRGCHGLAEKFPQICHAAVRLDSYAALSRASSDSKSKRS